MLTPLRWGGGHTNCTPLVVEVLLRDEKCGRWFGELDFSSEIEVENLPAGDAFEMAVMRDVRIKAHLAIFDVDLLRDTDLAEFF